MSDLTLEILDAIYSDTGKGFSEPVENVRDSYKLEQRQLRSLSLSGFAIAAFAVPVLIALANIGTLTSDQATAYSAGILAAAGIEFFLMSIGRVIQWYRFRGPTKAITRMRLVWSYLGAAFRTDVVGLTLVGPTQQLDRPTQRGILQDYYDLFLLVDSAIRFWLLGISGRYLDPELRKRYKEEVDYMADRTNAFWRIVERPSARITELLAGNHDIKQAITAYASYTPGGGSQVSHAVEPEKSKVLKRAFLLVAVAIATIFLTLIGLSNLTVWKFDAAVIGSFLFGDYVLRWLLRRRGVKTSGEFRVPEVLRPAFTYGWFFVFVVLVGDLAFLAAIFAKVLYGGPISPPLIGLLSTALCLALALDYVTNYEH